MPLISSFSKLVIYQSQFSEDELYNLSIKLNRNARTRKFVEQAFNWMMDQQAIKASKNAYKSYGSPDYYLKPLLSIFRKIDWEKVILKRKSSRNFNGNSITFQQLSALVLLSCGLKEKDSWLKKPNTKNSWPSRALPSGGGLYPLELYTLILNVKGMKKGLYHFNIKEGGFTLIRNDSDVFNFENFWAQESLFKKPAVLFFTTAVFNRSRAKYGSRALKFIFMEAGGIGTHMNLLANAMGIQFCFDGGGYDDQIEKLIGIDGKHEGLVSIWMVGHT